MAKAKLDSYRAKRDFARTPEPQGGRPGAGGNRFVVHKHHATADHYDLRLELDGVLKSWAVPKGPSLDPDDKRLAVETEDHPLDYIDFEGVIPAGEYGGGPMIVWDTGTWAPMEDPGESLAAGAFKFRLAGEKLRGGWMLARLKPKDGETRRNWLLFKERDQAADRETDVLEARPESVKSGRRIEDLLAEPPPTEPTPARSRPLRPGNLPGAAKAPLPDRLPPQLASAAAAPPEGDDWLHEIKLDGYRTTARIAGGEARLVTRSGLDWTGRYGALAGAFGALPCREAVIDGEVVVQDETGATHLTLLQEALSKGESERLIFYAFDLPFLDGWDLTAAPLVRRKALLATLLQGLPRNAPVQYLDHVEGGGGAFFERVSEMGLEGVIAKRGNAAYQPGRSRSWLKVKAVKVGDFAIAGFTASAATGGLGALALAEWRGDELAYVGKVGTGFDEATLADLLARLQPLEDGGVALDRAPKGIRWVRPVLTAHVHYATRTATGALRHAVFKGLREVAFAPADPAPRERLISDADLASVWVTNPTRRLFGRSGATKLDVAVYYASVGDFMLPHILGRPVSLIRCPTGRPQDCFFQRHAFSGMPPSVASFPVTTSDGETKSYIAIEDARGYLGLAQFGVVEFHSWGSHRQQLDKPDRVTFDLDPGEGIAWREIVEAAIHIRGVLEGLGLVPFVKTSGGKGIHVVVPIKPRLGWDKVHGATGAIAEAIAGAEPQTFVTTQAKDKRRRRIFIDFHRNVRGATSAAPYSLRARTSLPASAPINWPDLESVDAPEDLNYSSLPRLLQQAGDPWRDIDAAARALPTGRIRL